MNPDTHVPTSRLIHELHAATGQTVPGGYEAIIRMVRNGNLPADCVRGRYYIQRALLPAIAVQLGLTNPAQPVAA